jgi:nucleoside-diphosphate-sugar epimerase
MIRNASTVLAVGAGGKFAGLVIPELAKRGVTVRGLVKHKNQFDDVRHHGAAEIVVGDLTNRSSVRAGERLRLEITNWESAITEAPMTHWYGQKAGTNTYHHNATHPSHMCLHERPRGTETAGRETNI